MSQYTVTNNIDRKQICFHGSKDWKNLSLVPDLFLSNSQVDIGPDDASGDGQEGGGGGGEVVNDVVYPAEESGSGGLYYNSLSVSNSRLAHKHTRNFSRIWMPSLLLIF